MTFQEWVASKRGKKVGQDIEERWQQRVVPQGMCGAEGAERYLQAFGRSIASPKVIGLALCAELHGDQAMAQGFWAKAYELETGIRPSAGIVPAFVAAPCLSQAVPELPSIPSLPDHLRPGRFVTMQPTDAREGRAFYIGSEDYLGQPKRDGHRTVVWSTRAGEVYAQKRSLALTGLPGNMTAALREVAMGQGSFVLDGEFWWADARGGEHRTAPQAVQANVAAGQPSARPQPMYSVFACLYQETLGSLLAGQAEDRLRKGRALAQRLHELCRSFEALDTAASPAAKQELADHQRDTGREGEVWYRRDARYVGGKNNGAETMVRNKYVRELDVLVLGLTGTDKARAFGAVQVGVWEGDQARAIGAVGTGYTQAQMAELLALYEAAQAKGQYLAIVIKTRGLTESGSVWHASYEGISERPSQECTMDQEER